MNQTMQYIRIYTDLTTLGGGDVYIVSQTPTERKVATSFHFETVDEGSVLAPACLHLTRLGLQVLMDDLWRMGVRPAEGEGSVGAIAARKEHILDLRAALHLLIDRLPVSGVGKPDD